MKVFFLTGEWTGLKRYVRGDANFPEGMPSVYLPWLKYKERGYDVDVFISGSFEKTDVIDFHGCTIHLVRQPWFSRLLAKILGKKFGGIIMLLSDNICLYRSAARVARRSPPRIVYSLRPWNSSAARLLGKRFHCPCIKRIFGTGRLLYTELVRSSWIKSRLRHPLLLANWLCPADMTIITDDGTYGDKVSEILGIKKDRYRYWPNGIDKSWAVNAREAQRLREQMGFTANHFILLCLSRLAPWKRQDRVVRAMKFIMKDLPNARLVLAGDGPWRNYLTKLVTDFNLQPFVRFLGMVSHEEVQNVMAMADVFLQMDDNSCLGNTLLEAMVCGRTIVTWDVGGTSQVIIDGDTGCLLPNAEPATIAKAVISLAKDPEKAKRLGYNARRFVREKRQTWDERIDMEIDLVESLCS